MQRKLATLFYRKCKRHMALDLPLIYFYTCLLQKAIFCEASFYFLQVKLRQGSIIPSNLSMHLLSSFEAAATFC